MPAAYAPVDADLRALLDPGGVEDPYPLFARLCSRAPVHRAAGFGTCFVTGYAAAAQVLGGDGFAVQDPAWFDDRLPGWRDNAATRLLYQGLQSRNPPDHTRLRRVIGGVFTPRRMALWESRIGSLVDGLLEHIAARAGAPVDLMEALAFPLPIAVMGELLGVPEDERADFRRLTAAYLGMMDLLVGDDVRRRAAVAAAELRRYWLDVLASRRRTAGGTSDVAGLLAGALAAGEVSEEEAVTTLMFLFSAGYGTTAALLGTAVGNLLADPALGETLRRTPELTGAYLDEVLRHDSPSQLASRLTVRDVEVCGVPLPAGQHVTVLIGAANRDPACFPEPDRLDVRRYTAPGVPRPLSFGGGIHFCLGAALSRLEARVALPRLLRRFPGLRAGGPPERHRQLRMRMHARLPVRLGDGIVPNDRTPGPAVSAPA